MKKKNREDQYSGKVENIINEKFETLKREASFNINPSYVTKPGVVKNIFF